MKGRKWMWASAMEVWGWVARSKQAEAAACPDAGSAAGGSGAGGSVGRPVAGFAAGGSSTRAGGSAAVHMGAAGAPPKVPAVQPATLASSSADARMLASRSCLSIYVSVNLVRMNSKASFSPSIEPSGG